MSIYNIEYGNFSGTYDTETDEVDSKDIKTGLSKSQIKKGTEDVMYTSELFHDRTKCPISLDDFDDNEIVCKIRHCRHIFKRDYIMRWFENRTCCPVCRHNLKEDMNSPEIQIYSHIIISIVIVVEIIIVVMSFIRFYI